MKRRLAIIVLGLSAARLAPASLGDGPAGLADEIAAVPAGESESRVQIANLIYAGVKSSHCFSDHFLELAEKTTSISTNRRFHAVKVSSQDMFSHPLVIMTGEGDFMLSNEERSNLRRYLERGGFMLASAGCSSAPWDLAFRRELRRLFPDAEPFDVPLTHPVFHTATDISALRVRHGVARPFQGLELDGRLAVLYSPDGLNDSANASGCCCCGGNEVVNAGEINVNVLAYALAF